MKIDTKLMESKNATYKLRSVYEKNNLIYVEFETKFGIHRGTFKRDKLYINPVTNREFLYDEIDKAVVNLFNNKLNKKYIPSFSDSINKIFDVNKITSINNTNNKSIRETIISLIVKRPEETKRKEIIENE